jgi:septum formation protein
MPGRIWQREDQFVLDQLAHCHLLPRQYPVRRLRIDRIGIDLGLRRGEDQQIFLAHLEWYCLKAALTAQLQRTLHAYAQARAAALVAQAPDFVRDFPGVGSKQVAQPGKAADRHGPLLRSASRREFEAVDYRLVRHKARMISFLEKSRQNKVMAQSRRLILASTSRYRRELLERLGLTFETASPRFDETPLSGEGAVATALRLSVGKAQSLAGSFPDALIIGADQVASSDGLRLGKPGDHDNALRQLRLLSGKSAQFDTAVSLLDAREGQLQSRVVGCRVLFRALEDHRIEAYLRREQPYDCAGSAKAEGLGIALIERIDTEDPTSLVGLPLIALTAMLDRAGLPVI